MEEKLNRLYSECLEELKIIGINIDESKIKIKISKRSTKRYGCCKHQNPDLSTIYFERKGRKKVIKYRKYNSHIIEISMWVMNLNDEIIKNTIIHELLHTKDNCNNHGKEFKYYAKYINEKLGYNIKTLGNKEEDYLKSGLNLSEEKYKYTIQCIKCKNIFYRQRFNVDKVNKYRCGKCRGKLIVITKT